MTATDIGIYVLDSNSTTWVSQSVGLPNIIVQDIEFNLALDKVYLATFGSGIWSADLSALTGKNEQHIISDINIELNPTINYGNFTILMLDTKQKTDSFTMIFWM